MTTATAVAAGSPGSTGRTGTRAERSWHHWRAAGPTGGHAGRERSRENERPTGRTLRAARTEHAGVMTEGTIVPTDHRANEEDDGHDENNAGDDDYPRRNLVEARRPR
jgi:hypothetical protein